MTGYDRFEYAQKCCKMNVHDFLLKPIDEAVLRQAVERQIEEIQKKENELRSEKIRSRALGMNEQIQLEKKCRDLLEGNLSREEARKMLEEYDYDCQCMLEIAVILPVLEKTREWQENHKLLYLSIKNICISMFDMKKLGVTFEDQLGRICLLLFCRDDFEDTLKELKYILSSEFDMQVTLLVGSRVKHAEDLCYSYNEAIALLELSEIRKNEMIFTPDEEKRLRMFRDTVYELQGIMEDNLDKKEALIKAFSTFVRCMESYNLSDSMMRKEMFRVLSDLYYEYTLSKEEKTLN